MAQSEALPYVTVVLEDLKASLQYSASVSTIDEDVEDSHMDVELECQLPYHAPTVQVFLTFSKNQDDNWIASRCRPSPLSSCMDPYCSMQQASGSFILHVTCSTHYLGPTTIPRPKTWNDECG